MELSWILTLLPASALISFRSVSSHSWTPTEQCVIVTADFKRGVPVLEAGEEHEALLHVKNILESFPLHDDSSLFTQCGIVANIPYLTNHWNVRCFKPFPRGANQLFIRRDLSFLPYSLHSLHQDKIITKYMKPLRCVGYNCPKHAALTSLNYPATIACEWAL